MRHRLVPNYRKKTEEIAEWLETGKVSPDAVRKTFSKLPTVSVWISLGASPRGSKLFKLLVQVLETRAREALK